MDFKIRPAKDDDFDSVFDIWMDGVAISFDTTNVDEMHLKIKFKTIFLNRTPVFNYWVAVDEQCEIVGWQSLNRCTVNPLKDNCFAESSTYVKSKFRKFGIGELLLKHAVNFAIETDLQYITAYVNVENSAIRKICSEIGFNEVGVIPKSGKVTKSIEKIFIMKAV